MKPRRTASETTEKATEKTTEKATEKETVRRRIAKAIADDPFVTMDELAEMFGLTQDGVYYHIKALHGEMNLRRVGGRKTGHWVFRERRKGK